MNDMHAAHCLAAFAAGKHVFCEKPLAVTVQQCDEIIQAQKASGKHFATGFVLRCVFRVPCGRVVVYRRPGGANAVSCGSVLVHWCSCSHTLREDLRERCL